jgi:hypothetical protein
MSIEEDALICVVDIMLPKEERRGAFILRYSLF